MGTTCAPTYANIYLGWREETKVFIQEMHTHTQHVELWSRYIDDVLCLWSGTVEEFNNFMRVMNRNDHNLRLTSEINQDRIMFLDLEIFKDEHGLLQSTVHTKATATNNLLLFTSHHPKPQVEGIPVGQFLRVKINCSTIEDFEKQSEVMSKRFLNRGYSKSCVNKAYKRAKQSDRNRLLYAKKEINENQSSPIRIIGTYSKQWREIKQMIHKHWHILFEDEIYRKVLSDTPSITYRRPTNLSDSLVHSHYKTPIMTTWLTNTTTGTFKCGPCKACRFINPQKNFQNVSGTKTFAMKDFFNCKTCAVVYLL
ncbi:uncharacterized protein LOC142463627 [Ascaphus truei]|uniref:uncharacterized protein LOC142463627 n=1 Tax=Ascaphus truei TaxID=8439 RepID=UPI003F5A6E24